MTDKDKQAKAQDRDCALCMDDGKIWMVGLLGLVVGLLVMYLAYPAIVPPMSAPPAEGTPSEQAFVLDSAKADAIGALLSDTFFLNTGEETEVVFSRYEDEGTHVALYYKVSGQEIPVIVSKDYSYLYPSAIEYDEMEQEIADAMAAYEAQLEAELEGYPETEEPEVMLFIMSNCPYGNQAENGLVDAVELLEGSISFEPVYIIYDETVHPSYSAENEECYVNENVTYCSMHGRYELDQGIREKMIYNRYGEAKWAEYAVAVNEQCFAAGEDIEACWKSVAESMEINSTEIESSFEAEKFEILAHEKEVTFGMQQFGSPGILINGMEYSGSRSAEAFKAAICSAFSSEPADCTTELSESEAASEGTCG
jgi:hypothetical protein